ncbi:MAG TPA: twin-arginine translocase subunit TatC [Gaiellaceae bacterium]|nr:twin-arginine translocase subunit TatC [Gaiellaceae bacterium]
MRPPRRLGHGEQTDLVGHLDELRARLIVSLVAVCAGFAVAYAFHARIVGWLDQALPPEHRKPVTFGVAEPFTTSVKVSLAAGIALALPVVLWQVWSYLAPAVEQRAQRTISAFVGFASVLFALGVAFGYRVALPAAVRFLTTYDSRLYDIQVRASSYYSFALAVLVAVGVVFEVPVFVLALVRLRVVSAARLRRGWRGGLATTAVLAVVLPGVDPVTTTLEMVPLMALYLLSVGLATVFERRWAAPATTATEPPL